VLFTKASFELIARILDAPSFLPVRPAGFRLLALLLAERPRCRFDGHRANAPKDAC
jgi:hypothetical protein